MSIIAGLRRCFEEFGSWLLDKTAELLSLPVPENVNQPVRAHVQLVFHIGTHLQNDMPDA